MADSQEDEMKTTCLEFIGVYRQYRRAGHPRAYAAKIACGIAYEGLPF
jgi:predicted acetyltransferase